MFLLYLWDSLVTLELISLIPLVGSPDKDPLAVKLLDNRLYICGLHSLIWRVLPTTSDNVFEMAAMPFPCNGILPCSWQHTSNFSFLEIRSRISLGLQFFSRFHSKREEFETNYLREK